MNIMIEKPNSISLELYRKKVLGCWLGKAVGGTLGGPAEGKTGPLSLTYYDPVPDQMLPNDDLDLQVVWLETIRRNGLPVDRRLLAEAWLEHIHLWPDEYGVASRNLDQGIYPPFSGSFDNGFTAGMGAAIRTEIWACLAPGDPELAASLAREDACVDHADEGVYAAEFLAVIESAAFLESDSSILLDTGISMIPENCRVAQAISDTRRWWNENHDWMKAMEEILSQHGRQNFTDVAQNLAFIVLGWLAGGEDFSKAICTAVNCGQDTDCTGATLGALLGILNPDGIEEKWLKPIGRDLVLSPGMVGMHHAATLDEFTDQVTELAAQVLPYYGSNIDLLGSSNSNIYKRVDNSELIALPRDYDRTESLVSTQPLIVYVKYPNNVALVPDKSSELGLRIVNPTEEELELSLEVSAPDGWSVGKSEFGFHLAPEESENITIEIKPPDFPIRVYLNPLDLRFTCNGLSWTTTAGLITSIPWQRWSIVGMPEDCPQPAEDAESIEIPGHFQNIPDGSQAFATEFKLPYTYTARYVIQCPREVKVWLDGEEINHHDGSYLVPAIHRAGRTGKDIHLQRGWHCLTIAVGDGRGGQLFLAVGNGESWDWLRDIEWRG
jgi:ADP-ribosylglycohydrolase